MSRYSQQLLLPEIGTEGQKKLSSSRVLIVGAGGLGSVVATYLASMGIGTLGIADFDTINETNLHRQFWYNQTEVGQNKSTVLASKLALQNTEIDILAVPEAITNENFIHYSSYDIICDCSDNLNTRIVLDKKCFEYSIPLVHGAISDWQGYITVFHSYNQFRYSDLFDIKTLLKADSCETNGVSSPICGIIGSIMANETLKIILKINSNLDGGLFYFNSLTNDTRLLKLKK